MKKNICQAYTKKHKPCKNYAKKGSQFCYVHKELFKNFPPVKITALICPYCKDSIKRGAKFCDGCKRSFLICPYCDEPLRKDAKFCDFCKLDLTPEYAMPKDYGTLNVVDNSSALEGVGSGIGISWTVSFVLAVCFLGTYILLAYFISLVY